VNQVRADQRTFEVVKCCRCQSILLHPVKAEPTKELPVLKMPTISLAGCQYNLFGHFLVNLLHKENTVYVVARQSGDLKEAIA
jgi:hypothetical protein